MVVIVLCVIDKQNVILDKEDFKSLYDEAD